MLEPDAPDRRCRRVTLTSCWGSANARSFLATYTRPEPTRRAATHARGFYHRQDDLAERGHSCVNGLGVTGRWSALSRCDGRSTAVNRTFANTSLQRMQTSAPLKCFRL